MLVDGCGVEAKCKCQTPRLKADVGRGAKHRLPENAFRPLSTFLGPVMFLVSKETVLGTSGGLHFGSSRGSARLVDGGGSLALELGARFELLEQSEFSLIWQLVRNAWPLFSLNYRVCLADMSDCADCGSGLEVTAEHVFYYCGRVHPFWDHVGEWTARIKLKHLVLLGIGYVVDNILPQVQCEKCVVFLTILALARMVIWTMRKKGLCDDANSSHLDLILFFRHQLRIKIRCNRKRLDRITFNKRWVHAVSQVIWKGTTLESSFSPLPAHGDYGPGPSGLHPG